MSLYQKLKKHKDNLSSIGLEQREEQITYFCTPRGAKIIGWAGVDGIHYCTIRGFGEMIFAISPMNLPGEYVHPIARSFEELLGLLMSCGSMDAIEQAHQWDKDQFEKYLSDNPATDAHAEVMNMVRDKYGIVATEDPFGYIRGLQEEFDYSLIKYPPEYYDADMNPEAPTSPEAWKVTYDGGFWHNRGRAGREVAIKKSFVWGNEQWYIPSVYICGKGLVVDFCLEVDRDRLKAYIDKWDLLHESSNVYSREQQEQIQSENPLNPEFKAYISVNGKELRRNHGYAVSWIPADCLNQEYQPETESRRVLEHYGLDLNRGWAIHRCAFLWSTKRAPVIRSMQLAMKRSPVTVHGIHFASPSAGDVISFSHPVTGVRHTLTIHEYEEQALEQHHFRNEDMEYPACYHAMTYTLEPELGGDEFMLSDYNEGDRPRMKNPDPNEFSPVVCSSVAVIGGADGPTMILLAGGNSAKLHAACSSLYFEQPEAVEWYARFQVKTLDDIEVELA